MSPQYKCKDCGFKWSDVKLTGYFLKCLRCESSNVSPTGLKFKSKLMIWVTFFLITGIVGAAISLWFRSEFLDNWGDPWMFGLIGFLIGFIGLPIYICWEEYVD